MKKVKAIIIFFYFFTFGVTYSQSSEMMFLRVLTNVSNGQYEAALEKINTLIDQDNKDERYYLQRGTINEQLGRFGQALQDYEKAERLKKGIASYHLAVLYSKTGQYNKSILYLKNHLSSPYKKSSSEIKLDKAFQGMYSTPEWNELWEKRWYSTVEQKIEEAEYYIKNEDYIEALDIVDEQIDKHSKKHALYALRGDILLSLENYKGAIKNYKDAIQLNKRIPDYFESRAKAYELVGNLKKAYQDYSEAIQLNYTKPVLYLERAKIANKWGKSDQALEDIAKYLVFHPDDVNAIFTCGEIHYNKKQYHEAIKYYSKNINHARHESMYYIARGKAYKEIENYQKAYNDYSMALDLDPYNPHTYNLRGEVRLRMGDYKGACIDWQKASRKGSKKAKANILQYCH